jgi:hypothetical protein
MSNQLRLAVISPAYGGVISAEQARMWVEFGNIVGASNERFRLTVMGYVDVNPVSRARNQALMQAMLASSDWLFTVDADTWVIGDKQGNEDAGFQILRMISEAERRGAVLVSAPVVRRASQEQMRSGPGSYELAVYGEPGPDGTYQGKPLAWLDTLPRALTPVFAVGSACCAIKLKPITDIVGMYEFTKTLSEDLDFCRQIREGLGDGKIMVDPRVITGHTSRSFPLLSMER